MSILGLTREANNGEEKTRVTRGEERKWMATRVVQLVQQRIIIEEIRVARKVSRDEKKREK